MNNPETNTLIADMKKAFANKEFTLAKIRTNKGVKLNAWISREVVSRYLEQSRPHDELIADAQAGALPTVLQHPIAVWIHGESGNICSASFLGLVPQEEVKGDLTDITLLGLVVGITVSVQTIKAMDCFEAEVKQALKTKEQKARYEAYTQIPELNDLMQSNHITLENF